MRHLILVPLFATALLPGPVAAQTDPLAPMVDTLFSSLERANKLAQEKKISLATISVTAGTGGVWAAYEEVVNGRRVRITQAFENYKTILQDSINGLNESRFAVLDSEWKPIKGETIETVIRDLKQPGDSRVIRVRYNPISTFDHSVEYYELELKLTRGEVVELTPDNYEIRRVSRLRNGGVNVEAIQMRKYAYRFGKVELVAEIFPDKYIDVVEFDTEGRPHNYRLNVEPSKFKTGSNHWSTVYLDETSWKLLEEMEKVGKDFQGNKHVVNTNVAIQQMPRHLTALEQVEALAKNPELKSKLKPWKMPPEWLPKGGAGGVVILALIVVGLELHDVLANGESDQVAAATVEGAATATASLALQTSANPDLVKARIKNKLAGDDADAFVQQVLITEAICSGWETEL